MFFSESFTKQQKGGSKHDLLLGNPVDGRWIRKNRILNGQKVTNRVNEPHY